MKYQYVFEWLDGLIAETVNPEHETASRLKPGKIQGTIKQVETETAGIKATLVKELFCIKNERVLKLRIEQYQTTLVRLLDAVYQHSKRGPA